MKKVFIDGSAGTTGLRIRERLLGRTDIELIGLPEEMRKDASARRAALNAADIVFLCLPDAAAIEAVSMVENDRTVVIDASTAHRTNPAFAYGFPELGDAFAEKIRASKRIAVPGCHASGFIALVYPLISAGILPSDALLSFHSVTGYSGGGKTMIADYEREGRDEMLSAPRQYALSQTHKHLPEMQAVTGLAHAPVFSPIVSDFYSGMVVTLPLFREQLAPGKTAADIRAAYAGLYRGPVVRYTEGADESGFLSALRLCGKDAMEISVFGSDERILAVARYDNLGKGASGAAVECMNIVMGADPCEALEL